MKLALILSLGLNVVLACAVLLLANRMGYLGRLFVVYNLTKLLVGIFRAMDDQFAMGLSTRQPQFS